MSQKLAKQEPTTSDYYRLALAISQIHKWRYYDNQRLQTSFAAAFGLLLIAAGVNLDKAVGFAGIAALLMAILILGYWGFIQSRINQSMANAERTFKRFQKNFGNDRLVEFLTDLGYFNHPAKKPFDASRMAKSIYHFMIRHNHYREARLVDQIDLTQDRVDRIGAMDQFFKDHHVEVAIDHEFVKRKQRLLAASEVRQKLLKKKDSH